MKKFLFKPCAAKHKFLTAALFLSLLSGSLTGCGFASSNTAHLAETTAAFYDETATLEFSAGAGMPAGVSKSASVPFRSNDAGDSVEEAAVDTGEYQADSNTFLNESGSTELPQNVANTQEPAERKLIRNVNMKDRKSVV